MQARSKSISNLVFIVVLLISLLGGAMTYTPAHAASILHVKPVATGMGDCSSWANACNLQAALAFPSFGDQIWVEAGTYTPAPSDRTGSFILSNGVAIYGGFAGTETQLTQRNPSPNVTILSGDLSGNDIGFTNNGENSYHVVVGTNLNSSAKLDGFTIRGGNANGDSFSGGGMSNSNSSPTLSNLIFSNNSADSQGGGIFNHNSSPTLTNVTFIGNTAGDGGGIFNDNSNPTLTNVTVSGNSAFNGGGIANLGVSNPTLTNVTFSGNSASTGGGIYNDGAGATLTNATFSANHVEFYGGGIYNTDNSIVTLTNATFSGNSAGQNGGGLDNVASSSATLTNVTFSNNSASPGNGGGMINFNGSILTLINTIIANSPSGGDCVNYISTLDANSSNNLIQDASNACGLINGVNGNIVGANPNLGPLADNGGPTQTHALLPGSPAIDQGNDANCPTTDQRGLSRPQGSHCDMGAYEFALRTITGNAGMPNATLSYTDGTPKTVTSQPDRSYSITIPSGWSGMVTPSQPCFTFSPNNRTYSNILTNQTAQNYTANFNAASGCANVNVKIGGVSFGPYGILPQGSLRVSYVGQNNGPINVTSTNGKPIIAAERVISYSDATKTKISHFSEMMGLPQSLVSNTYAFPAYDDLNFDSQLRFGNLSNSTATVHVFINGVEMHSGCSPSNSPYTLPAGTSLRVSCPGVNQGPVRIVSNTNIVAALRVLYNTSGTVTSFSEMMGLPASQWSTTYWMPWYNNVSLNSQLRIANVSGATATIHVYIHGAEMKSGCTKDGIAPLPSPFTIPALQSQRMVCPINDGPVQIVSNVPIVASMRVAHFITSTDPHGNDFSELMGLPDSQKSTSYLFPWYNNLNLDSQLRFGNISTSIAHVHVSIGGTEMAGSPFTLAPGASTRQSFPGISNGPVRVVSDQTIVASLRVVINNGGWPAFSELMGLPQGLLTTNYVLPWYNNVNLDTQLRFGVP